MLQERKPSSLPFYPSYRVMYSSEWMELSPLLASWTDLNCLSQSVKFQPSVTQERSCFSQNEAWVFCFIIGRCFPFFMSQMMYMDVKQDLGSQFPNVGEGDLRGKPQKTPQRQSLTQNGDLKYHQAMLKPQLPATSIADVTIIHARVRPGGEIRHCSCLHTLHRIPFCFEVSGTQYAIYLFAPFHLEKEGSLRSFTTLLRLLYIFAAFVDLMKSHSQVVKQYL